MNRSRVTTHVLDTSIGRPAAGIKVDLMARADAHWTRIATGVTDGDGRIQSLGPANLAAGSYQLVFATGAYFENQRVATFFPEVTLTFVITATDQHYHVPLLLSPFAYSTYRGS